MWCDAVPILTCPMTEGVALGIPQMLFQEVALAASSLFGAWGQSQCDQHWGVYSHCPSQEH